MQSPSIHALPEHWTELSAAKRQRKLCAEDVKALQRSCSKECGKKKVTECTNCYGKALDRMRKRYTESREREWFSQRRAFLHELEGLFQEAKEGKRSLESIEARIESEKEAWYRWVLRRYPEFIAVAEGGGGGAAAAGGGGGGGASSSSASSQDDLRSMLDDPDRSRNELVNMMLRGVGAPPGGPSAIEAFAEKVSASDRDKASLKTLYLSEFFSSEEAGSARKYLDGYRTGNNDEDNSSSLEDVIDAIVSDLKQSRASQPARTAQQKRLDELRRAKTAFEQNKSQVRSQALSRRAAANAAAAVAAAAVREELYDLPPCSVCRSPVPASGVLSCSLCQAFAQLGGDGMMTVYCSESCLAKGHNDHIDKAHVCEAGDKCLQLQATTTTESQEWKSTTCRSCVEQSRRIPLYCSESCGRKNHLPPPSSTCSSSSSSSSSSSAHHQDLVPIKSFLPQVLADANPGLFMSRFETSA
ncbi:hypothetical protein L249_3940 [Ophiocordyceps polyrhachis-furcata BCC 54312]|uniref:MYND-type zinc finger protein samB n=1 Tax=Ophiocordyceps polyrhachis-furcata BCC 54312 TaxID=1330021 RepID=A0A367L5M6_9HYPO|nr:hypothetical protein L249_3940 [Ophiocordyceps polyrhachis-furcata BCC 54312]